MASARGSNEDALAYEQIRLATIASNKKKLDSLNLASMLNVAPKDPSKIRKKACPNMFISAFFIITIDSIMFLCCRGLITQVLQQLKITICVQGHKEIVLRRREKLQQMKVIICAQGRKEILLRRTQMSRMVKILSANQLEISQVTMMVLIPFI